jgi:hypothetical protein
VKDEIGYAIDSGKHILPVMIKQCDVPFRLRRFQFVDFTKDDYDERFTDIQALLSNTTQLPTAAEAEKSSSPVKVPVPKPGGQQLFSKPVLFGGGALLLIAIVIGIIVMSGNKSTAAIPTATESPALPTKTSEPVVVVVTSTSPPTPTTPPDVPTPEPQPFYTEEFNGDLSNWSSYVTSGDENRMNVYTDDSKMIFELNDPNSDLFAYYVLDAFTYTDVKMETVANNRGVNDNNVSLICRYTNRGWYEFNIANNGLYWIFAYDSVGTISQGYNQLFAGGSTAIKSGQGTNTYSATCNGNKLTLSINGEVVRTITENQFRFGEGKIGLSVSSFQVLPVNVQFESLKISEP